MRVRLHENYLLFFFRIITFILTILLSFTLIFIILQFVPASIVELLIASYRSKGQYYDPKAIIELRERLYELFGLGGNIVDQYFRFLNRFVLLEFGSSLIAFPTPVKEIIALRLPWTVGLLSITAIISWIMGNILGVLASERSSAISRTLRAIAVTLYPIPYYIFALVLIFIFSYLIPLFPLIGGITTVSPSLTIYDMVYLIKSSILPALSIIIVSGFGWWFLSSSSLAQVVQNEDFHKFAILRGLSSNLILKRYTLRNVILPQITALGLALGGIFSGALLVEVVFAYPGLGYLLYRAILGGDIPTTLGILSLSVIGVSAATLILDLIYPLLDPRVRHR